MPLTGWNPLAPVLQTVAAFSRHILIAPDAGLDDHRLRPLLALSLSPPSPAPPQPEFPDEPTRQQRRDAKELMHIISRLYPCKECADHFKEVLKANPVQAGSQADFSQWLCYVHNVVNRSLGKPIFPCQRVTARWGKLDCPERSCDLEGSIDIMPNR
ncbi:Augmenter of liver regeneration [Zea mays]|uniref:Sulfhydryl oxidase n=1 Tax=Zea mays TaxID=4577 RepID=A0A1D6JRN4_MAIZE|nr:Augmenter of liver regeneration [Zea mays]